MADLVKVNFTIQCDREGCKATAPMSITVLKGLEDSVTPRTAKNVMTNGIAAINSSRNRLKGFHLPDDLEWSTGVDCMGEGGQPTFRLYPTAPNNKHMMPDDLKKIKRLDVVDLGVEGPSNSREREK